MNFSFIVLCRKLTKIIDKTLLEIFCMFCVTRKRIREAMLRILKVFWCEILQSIWFEAFYDQKATFHVEFSKKQKNFNSFPLKTEVFKRIWVLKYIKKSSRSPKAIVKSLQPTKSQFSNQNRSFFNFAKKQWKSNKYFFLFNYRRTIKIPIKQFSFND